MVKMKRSASRTIFLYALAGVLFGLMFPLGGWIIEMAFEGVPISYESLSIIHIHNKLLFVIDIAPFVLCIFSLIGGVKQANIQKVSLALETSFEKLESLMKNLREKETFQTSTIERADKFIIDISKISGDYDTNRTFELRAAHDSQGVGMERKDITESITWNKAVYICTNINILRSMDIWLK